MIDLHRFQKARDQVVGANGGRQFDHLAFIEVNLHGVEHGLGHVDVAGHGFAVRQSALLDGVEQAPVARSQRGDLLLGDTFGQREGGMRPKLVVRAVQDGDAHDDQLPYPGAEAALLTDGREESEPTLGDGRAVQ